MSDWIQALIIRWESPATWNLALSAFLQKNNFAAPDTILSLFENLRELPHFSNHSQALLPIFLLSGNIKSALTQFLDFYRAFEQRVKHPFDFEQPHVSTLLNIFGRSNFLSRRLVNQPQLSTTILQSTYLKEPKSLEVMRSELRQRLNVHGELDMTTVKKELRTYKYEEFLRITIRDLSELAPFEETLEELSSIATCCLQIALEAADKIGKGQSSFQISETSADQKSMPFIVIGMGKLGGRELNYSSDIDPIFLCNVDPAQYPPPVTTNKTLLKVARCLIDLIGDLTAEGFVARIDMRLRPGGETSPLFQSLEDTELYYESYGEQWERQAWIKARPVAGDMELGEMFIKNLAPFVYRKMLDENMLKEIQKIKERIEKEHLKQHLNVKLGVGGIREIEFFVQIFQLLYGGNNPALRVQNTLEAIAVLTQANHILRSDAETLRKSYLYLRKLEHRLQMEEELQTHTLPGDPKKQEILARCMGYTEERITVARRHLLQDVSDVMTRVRSIFGGLFNQECMEIEAAICSSTRFKHIPSDIQKLASNSARQFTAVIQQSQANLNIRFQQLFQRIGSKLHYYEHLLEYPASLQRLAGIAETSEFLWNYVLNHLELLKQLDATEVLHSRTEWEEQLAARLEACDDEESHIDTLREFKHEVTFLIGSAELEGILPYKQARQRLTVLAEVVIQAAFHLAKQQLSPRFGIPQTPEGPAKLAIIGMGKLGGKELTYHSDLDLIFICSDVGRTTGPKQVSNYEYFAKLIQRFISILSTFTTPGLAYHVDTRLRPSGNAGPLVSTLAFYREYHQTSQPWEHQALIKGRMVGGDFEESWVASLEQTITDVVYAWKPPDHLNQEITHLRLRKEKELSNETKSCKNIKEGYGGLLDIEYLTQYLQLQQGAKIPKLRVSCTLDFLEQCAIYQVLEAETAQTLVKAYMFYRLLESYLRLLCDTSTNMIDFENLQTDKLVTLLHRHGYSVTDVLEAYQQTTNTVRKIYLQIMQVE